MRCLEEICKQELDEEFMLEILAMDNSDVDMFMTEKEYNECGDCCATFFHTDGFDRIDYSVSRDKDTESKNKAEDEYQLHAYKSDDDDIPLTTNDIISHYDGSVELDALSASDVNNSYDSDNKEDRYDG